jgi:HipA-like C-terminal domain
MLGNATKWVLRTYNPLDPQFMVKLPQKFGEQETYTEFFINQFGKSIGFDLAESGLLRLDGQLAFLTRIFTSPGENLRHGSLIIEDCFKDEKALERVRRKEEQAFYSIDFVVGVMKLFVGDDFDAIFPKFIEMLVFDALTGSMDRHAQNWGVLETVTKPARYRFAPVFDSARALLWSMSQEQVANLSADGKAFNAHLLRARPCLGPKRHILKQGHCNHFEFVGNLLELYREPTERAIQRVPENVAQRCNSLLRSFPFESAFSNLRKQLIVKIVAERAETLRDILAKGGTQ